jgi:ABC-type phosphate transport system substrate-binding protein
MTRFSRLAVGAVLGTGSLLLAVTAQAQTTMCSDLMNPIIVSGSTAFETTLKTVAVKLSAEALPATIVYTQAASVMGSCNGVSSIVNDTDLSGQAGRYYTLVGGTITNMACTFAAGQKAHVGISDVYYESCAGMPAKPANLMDVSGPVQAMLFIVPKMNTTTQYLSYKEAQVLYGCGVSTTNTVAGFSDPAGVYCRDPNSGTQITIAKNIGVPESMIIPQKCVNGGGTGGVGDGVFNFAMPQQAIGFVAADYFDGQRTRFNALAFEALGQTKAYYSDSGPDVADRKNVRDGHYGIWGYEHFIVKTTNGALSAQASDFIGYFNGTKTSPNFDYVALEGGAGVIPLCAMKVQRSADGGLMSPYAPTDSCNCAFEAAIGKTATPAGCTACSASTPCATGTCRHGFCE